VSVEHLNRYLAEFDYRYSTRKMTDEARMRKLFGQVDGRRELQPDQGQGQLGVLILRVVVRLGLLLVE
jgi:hypothetical protein